MNNNEQEMPACNENSAITKGIINEKDIENIFNKCFDNIDFQLDDILTNVIIEYLSAKMQPFESKVRVLRNAALFWFLQNRKNSLDTELFAKKFKEFFKLIDDTIKD